MNTATIDSETIASDQTVSLSEVESFVHDLRNPLAAIHVSAEILIRSSLSQPQVHRLARNMYSASVQMRELLEQCLDRSRRGGKEFEDSDLREVVSSAVERIAVTAELQSVRIVQDLRESLFIAMDSQRIRRVLVNLLVNALEAMPRGGSIHISAVPDGRSVLIRVRDTGLGVPAEIWDRLFQPFATAGKPHGVGLGLALARQAVTHHGGEMWAEPECRGACFVIRLPRTIARRRAASC